MDGKNILVISPHADDVTIFLGGTVRKLANDGMNVYVVRVTNDDFDSFGLSVQETIKNNKEDAEKAYGILGVYKTIHLGYVSDHLASVDYISLREKFVRLIRQIRPHSVYSFDIDGKDEDNMDHKICTNAFTEALWISSFNLHHVEHFSEGLEPYCVPNRIYFARNPEGSNYPVDISDVIEQKIEALKCHKSVMKNFFQQIDTRAKSLGRNLDILSETPIELLIEDFTRKYAIMLGAGVGMEYAELFRDTGAGLLDSLL